jgi:hypothetical protein
MGPSQKNRKIDEDVQDISCADPENSALSDSNLPFKDKMD